jgi:hypothetical protein
MNPDKERLLEVLGKVCGVIPENPRLILRALTHPDVIEYTKAYVDSMDEAGRCTRYEAPWNCAREADSLYLNIKYGWQAAPGQGYSDSWCENCRKKAMGDIAVEPRRDDDAEIKAALQILEGQIDLNNNSEPI